MTNPRRQRIAAAFAGAENYDRHARVQHVAADRLAARIAALGLDAPRLLEFGCGTGFLTAAMQESGLGGDWLVTDLAPAMVARCRSRLGTRPGMRFATFDAESGTPPDAGRYGLIVASLAVQWFDDLDAAVARMLGWLAPGGHLLFNTLGSQSFGEWRAAVQRAGGAAGTPRYPDIATLAAIRPDAQVAPPQVDSIVDRPADAREFLASLKAIGAHVPAPGHRPMSVAMLRRAMAELDRAGCAISYEVVTCHYRRPPAPPPAPPVARKVPAA